jgi:hypothetical protein
MILLDSDLKYLRDLWYENSWAHQPYFIGTKIQVGQLITTTRHSALEKFVRDKFEIDTELGGQLAYLTRPLSVHADVLFDIPDHFTTKQVCSTQYVVIDTDATKPMHTFVFDQTVIPDKWTGLKDGTDAVENMAETTAKDLFEEDQIDHLLSGSLKVGLSLYETIPLDIGKSVKWPSHHLHCGESFTSSGATYKLHLTVLAPAYGDEPWYHKSQEETNEGVLLRSIGLN